MRGTAPSFFGTFFIWIYWIWKRGTCRRRFRCLTGRLHEKNRRLKRNWGRVGWRVCESGTSFYRFFRIFKNLFYVHFGCFLRNWVKLCCCFTVYFTVGTVNSAEQGMFGLTVFIWFSVVWIVTEMAGSADGVCIHDLFCSFLWAVLIERGFMRMCWTSCIIRFPPAPQDGW